MPADYKKIISPELSIVSTRPEHASQLEQLQEIVFPTLSKESLFRSAHYLNHIRIFPEGQFVALWNEKVVGMTTTIRYHLDLHDTHTFLDVLDGGFVNTHELQGEWLYGLDVGTHPDFRKMGIGRHLYDARQQTAINLNLKGQYTYGMLTGYGALKDQIAATVYYEELLSGKRKDPTVSRQMANGFEPHHLVADYVEDPVCDGYCVLLIRKNLNYKP
jgi:GNAT superfamily N-acetyltransferase